MKWPSMKWLVKKEVPAMTEEDVTAQVEVDFPDDETMPIRRCVCGKKYGSWQETISIYRDSAEPMSCCGKKLYWVPSWKIMQVKKL